MKKFALLLSLLATQSAFAWHFTQADYHDRSYEFVNDYDTSILISEVRCTKKDGYDTLRVDGYYSPSGKFNPISKTFKGTKVKQVDEVADDILASYMKFCANVNKMN